MVHYRHGQQSKGRLQMAVTAKQAQVKTNDTGAQQWFPEIQEKGH
jgi:hypothetical protein